MTRKYDLKQAADLLTALGQELVTLQVFPKEVAGKPLYIKDYAPKYIGKAVAGGSAYCFKGPIGKQNGLLIDLKHLNDAGYSIYYMANQGDGIIHEGKKTPRSQNSVRKLLSVFVDTDDGDVNILLKYLADRKVKPHRVIRTRKNRYHVYILINAAPNTNANLSLWLGLQQHLASLDPGYDDAMADSARVLRLPGFYNCKQKPHKVTTIRSFDHKPYDLEYLHNVLEATAADSSTQRSSRYQLPTELIPSGKRTDALKSYIGHILATETTNESLVYSAALGFTQQQFADPHQWLPNNPEHETLTNLVHNLTNSQVREERRQDAQSAIDILDSAPEVENAPLPDSFYLNAPGLIGTITREICQTSINPYPSFACAAALSLVGYMKAGMARSSFRNTPPTDYFMCFEKSGRGKDFPRKAILNTLKNLKFGLDGITQKFRSAQGLHRAIGNSTAAGASHLILHDEAHHFFGMLKDSGNDYVKQILPMILELYSAHDNPKFDAGMVVTSRNSLEPIAHPCVGYLGFGVPQNKEDTFSLAALQQGLLNRFVIFEESHPIPEEQNQDVPEHFKFEDALFKLWSYYTDLDSLEDADMRRGFRIIPYVSDAGALYDEYIREVAKKRNKGSEAVDLLWSRAVEHVGRIAVQVAMKRITESTLQWCIDLVNDRTRAMEQYVEDISSSDASRAYESAARVITRLVKRNKKPAKRTDIMKYCNFRNVREMDEALKFLVSEGTIDEVQNYKSHPNSKKTTGYIPRQ